MVTTRLDLIQPADSDNVDIDELNDNFAKIDAWKIPTCKMRRSTGAGTQSINNNTQTPVDFNTAVWDSWAAEPEGAMADAANNVIKAPIAGLYTCKGQVGFTSNATGARAIMIVVNGTVQIRSQVPPVNGASTGLNIAYDLPLNAADQVRLDVVQTSGGPLTIDPTLPDGIDAISLQLSWIGQKP